MQTLNGHFDGKVIILDEPADLAPNTRVKILAPNAGENDASLAGEFAAMSETTFGKIWDNNLDADYDRL
jgi:hypothetical protein